MPLNDCMNDACTADGKWPERDRESRWKILSVTANEAVEMIMLVITP